ncbi:unnamed protein product [Caenorhabditis auriculariae]|uniref:BTB domain-containing protein n=1 Tax=Caenorhabditis auriculariae TaxID=2777116 RepID=A0A8S1HAX2_9PELO|nr:unnamed protein product [Caenorhabditis auriculariae]
MSPPMETSSSTTVASRDFKLEFDVVVRLRHASEDLSEVLEEPVLTHRLVLSSYSPFFRQLLAHSDEKMTSIDVDLTHLPNALHAFKSMISALYSGDVSFDKAQPSEVLAVCRACQVPSIESKVLTSSVVDVTKMVKQETVERTQPLDLSQASNNAQDYFHAMTSLWLSAQSHPLMNAFFSAPFIATPTSPIVVDDAVASRAQSESQSSGSSPRANSVTTPPSSADNEKIVPNDDKEGWCRNKKYIEKVEGGFMCTVCRKIYGRYNSVSYHVTIYHRNPPIRCDENGCNFSTREARYIHFHKYYRHHTPLPENIDLGSRKCPFCRHVSKSPAMLEKHITRHENDGTKKAKEAMKQLKPKPLSDRRIRSDPGLPLTPPGVLLPPPIPLKCTLCPFSTGGADALFLHLATCHAAELSQLAASVDFQTPSLLPNISAKPLMNDGLAVLPLQVDATI